MPFNYTNSYFITFDNAFDQVKDVVSFGHYIGDVVKDFDPSFWAQHNAWHHKINVMENGRLILFLEQFQLKNSYRIQVNNAYRPNIYMMIRLMNQITNDYNTRIKNSKGFIECIPKVNNYLEFIKTIFSADDKVSNIYKSDKIYYPSFFFADKKYNNFA